MLKTFFKLFPIYIVGLVSGEIVILEGIGALGSALIGGLVGFSIYQYGGLVFPSELE